MRCFAIAQGLAREIRSGIRKWSVICLIDAHDADTKDIGERETGLNVLLAIAQGLAGGVVVVWHNTPFLMILLVLIYQKIG